MKMMIGDDVIGADDGDAIEIGDTIMTMAKTMMEDDAQKS